jgi:RNA polymerase sigma-70 factor (ECF subfamily)
MDSTSSQDHLWRRVIPLAYRQLPASDLLARATAGDTEAYIALICLKYPLVAAVCLNTLRRAAPAEDVIQEVFVALWRQRATIRSADALDGWLRRTARNIARKHLAREAKRHQVHQEWRLRNPELTSGHSPDTEAIRAEIVQRVRQVLAAQSEEDQQLLRIAEKSEGDAEAAEALGLTVSAYRVRLHRARKRLANLLRKYGVAPAAGFAAFLSRRKTWAATLVALRWGTTTGKLKLLGLLVVFIFGFGLLWATFKPRTPPTAAPPAVVPAVVVDTRESLEQRNLRIMRQEIANPVRDLVQKFYPADNPVRVTGLRAVASEVEIEFEMTRPVPALTGLATRLRMRYCTFRRHLSVEGQPHGEKKWYSMNPMKPWVSYAWSPFTGKVEIVRGREEYVEVERLFARLPPDERAGPELIDRLFAPSASELHLPANLRGCAGFPGGLVVAHGSGALFIRDNSGEWHYAGECAGDQPAVVNDYIFCLRDGAVWTRPLAQYAAAWAKWCDNPALRAGERYFSLFSSGDKLYMTVHPGWMYSRTVTPIGPDWVRSPHSLWPWGIAATSETVFAHNSKDLFAKAVGEPETAWTKVGIWPTDCATLVVDGERLLAFGGSGPIYARPVTRTVEDWVIVGKVFDPEKR